MAGHHAPYPPEFRRESANGLKTFHAHAPAVEPGIRHMRPCGVSRGSVALFASMCLAGNFGMTFRWEVAIYFVRTGVVRTK